MRFTRISFVVVVIIIDGTIQQQFVIQAFLVSIIISAFVWYGLVVVIHIIFGNANTRSRLNHG